MNFIVYALGGLGVRVYDITATDLQQVHLELAKTIQEIQVKEEFGRIECKPFPKLSRLNEKEIEAIISLLSSGKAQAYDGITDALFRKERILLTETEQRNPPKFLYRSTIHKLRDLWRCELDELLTGDDTWAGRLIPLNKVSPKTPNRKQLRPILVQSPIVKLLEARFLPKLQEYLTNRLTPCQTGFVPQMGI